MDEIDHIRIVPDTPGWKISLTFYNPEGEPAARVYEFGVGDVIQFYDEVERTLGKWLADGPADFHGAAETSDEVPWITHDEDGYGNLLHVEGHGSVIDKVEPCNCPAFPVVTDKQLEAMGLPTEVPDEVLDELASEDPDLARDIERGK